MKTQINPYLKASALLGSAVVATSLAHASADYGPAIWNPPCNANYYTSGNGHLFHVIHDMEGYYLSTVSSFNSCNTTTKSVHYLVNGKKDASSDAPAGEITQMIRDADYAWHVRCWNTYCTGTEHEGFASNPAWYTEEMYQASSGISRHEASAFGFTKDRNHIVGHNEHNNAAWRSYASAHFGIDTTCNTHQDPGVYWDWSHYMQLVNGINGTDVTSPSIITRSNGKVDAFVVTAASGDVQYREKAGVGGTWGAWVSLGGSSFEFVRATAIDNGGVAVFGMGSGEIYYKYLANSNSTTWSSWIDIGGSGFASIVPIMKTDGEMAVIGCGNGTTIYYKEQTATGPGAGWTSWTDLASSGFWEVDGLALPSGGVAIFGVGSSSMAWYKYKSTGTSAWSGWANLGGSGFSHISAVMETGGKMAFFGSGDGAGSPIYYQEQSSAGATAGWSGWISLGGSGFSCVSGVALPNNGIAVFGCKDFDTGSTEFYKIRTTATGAWSGYVDLSATGVHRVAATADAAGLMTTVMRGGESAPLYERHETDATHWAGWTDLGNALE